MALGCVMAFRNVIVVVVAEGHGRPDMTFLSATGMFHPIAAYE
jgi:hypothetical protein